MEDFRNLKWFKSNESEIEVDRFSNLPDSIIIDQILSRLPETRFAIRTGILSKRFQYLWQWVRSLRFDDFFFVNAAIDLLGDFDYRDKAFLEFFVAVDKSLPQFQVESIDKFELDTNYDSRFALYVKNWIEFAVSKNVKQFKMKLRYVGDDDEFSIDSESFFLNSHFTDIEVGYCTLNPTVCISWSNLTCLSISHSKLDESLIPNIVSGSPLLTTLTFHYCHGSFIDIRSNSVKNLVLVGYEEEESGKPLEINAPKISSLIIIGQLWISNILLRDVSSLVKANLNFEVPRYFKRIRKHDEEEILNGLILRMKHLNELKVGLSLYPVIFCFFIYLLRLIISIL